MSLEYNGMSQITSRTNRERKFERVNVPGSEYSWVRKFQGANVPRPIRSGERKFQGAKVPGSKLARVLLARIGPGAKRLWIFKMRQNPFSAGALPRTLLGELSRPDPLVGWRGDNPPHTPPHSARTHLWRSTCVPPEV